MSATPTATHPTGLSGRQRRPGRAIAALAAATMLAGMPAAAMAQTSEDLARRLADLEASVAQLRAELAAARAGQPAPVGTTPNTTTQSGATGAQAVTPAAGVTAVAGGVTPAAATPDGYRSGASTIKLGGFVKTVAAVSRFGDGAVPGNSLGRDFYLPQAIPVGGAATTDTDLSAKQTRLWVNIATDVAGHKLGGYLETDFQTAAGTQGSERTTNGYDLALRRAYVTFDEFTIGQDWTTFQYTAALPESTDFVGVTEGTVFVRQPLIRYSKKMGPTTLMVSVENPETASALTTGPALIENDTDRMPDFAARVVHTAPFGELSLAGVVRQLDVRNGAIDANALGWGVSGAGKIPFGPDKKSDIRFMATYGQGIGRYVGLNFGADAILDAAANGGEGRLARTRTFGAFAALRYAITPTVRANIMGSYQNVDYPGGFVPGTFGLYNDSAWSAAANVFWSPMKFVDLGFEYRHGERELVSGVEGDLNRFEFAARYNF